MTRRRRTKRGRPVYAQCRVAAEPRLGQIKQERGYRKPLLRALQKARRGGPGLMRSRVSAIS